MRVVIQRVLKASVEVENKIVGSIDKGLLVLFGTKEGDKKDQLSYLIDKLINLRIFPDENDKLNLSLKDIEGEILIVSQFTLYGDCSKGRRPSFVHAQKPEEAKKIYELFLSEMKKEIKKVESGIFGAKMKVSLINDGPVTFIIDAKE